jgi:predicted nuclease of restriction endonuclease-like RecB superfamily
MDVSPTICFYSTWEANIARVFNLIDIKWVYAPKIFNLGEHTYRPDFYLPDSDTYIEVKNFMGEYSLNRDIQFRKIYPNTKLDLILKKEYMEIKANYKYFMTSSFGG